MKLTDLNETPDYQDTDRQHIGGPHPELCKRVDLKLINVFDGGISIDKPFIVRVLGNKYYCIDEDGTIASILEATLTTVIKQDFNGRVIHEESIDTCSKYRGKRITSSFYLSILKNKVSILSDYEHYRGTKRLWQSLSKQQDVIIQVYKNHKLIEKDYDLIKDELKVWSSNKYLLLATTNKIFEDLKYRLIPIE